MCVPTAICAAVSTGSRRDERRISCEEGQTGLGERNSAVMSDAGAVVRFVWVTVAREHTHTA